MQMQVLVHIVNSQLLLVCTFLLPVIHVALQVWIFIFLLTHTVVTLLILSQLHFNWYDSLSGYWYYYSVHARCRLA